MAVRMGAVMGSVQAGNDLIRSAVFGSDCSWPLLIGSALHLTRKLDTGGSSAGRRCGTAALLFLAVFIWA